MSLIPSTMRAVLCPSVPIPPSGLIFTTTHPSPHPKPGFVLIRIRAFGLNRSELFTRQGHSPGIVFPRVLGIECVGEVVDAGGNDIWKEGDVVAAIMGGLGRKFDGGYAEYTLAPHAAVSRPISLPSNLGWAELAAIPETFMTAYGTLRDSLKLEASDTLLIRGGTTSAGLALATLAKSPLFSCSQIISTTRSPHKAELMTSAGVDAVVLDSGAIAEDIMKLTAGKGADKCVELIGATTLIDSCASLSPEGTVSFVGMVGGSWVMKEFDVMPALAPRKKLTMYESGTLDFTNGPLQEIVDAISKDQMRLGLHKVFKMEEAGEAHAYMEANKATGKVVCLVD